MSDSIQTQSFIFVTFQVEGFHYWKDATGDRAYLAERHRHLFHVKVNLEVYYNDREIEFHNLLSFCRQVFPGGEMGGQSCEMMARSILENLLKEYGDRAVRVSVAEDGECGAIVQNWIVEPVRPRSHRYGDAIELC